jgi:penicillin-binding protein 1A
LGRGEAGSKAALPIWIDYMRTALNNSKPVTEPLPEFIEEGWVHRDTGKRTSELDPDAIAEYFPIEALLPEPFGEMGLSEYQRKVLLEVDDPLSHEVLEEIDLDAINAQYDALGASTEEEMELEPPTIEQKDRIIEDEEDTEGLF